MDKYTDKLSIVVTWSNTAVSLKSCSYYFLFFIATIVLFKLKLTSIVFNPQLAKLSSIYLENKPLKY